MKRILPLFLLLALVLNGCSSLNKSTPQAASRRLLRSPAWFRWVHLLPNMGVVARPLISDFTNIGPRVAGSDGETKAAQYIATVFKAIGYTPETQPFTAAAGNKSITSANVMAVKKGTSSQEIIVGAHYDSTDAGPGADDNASGVAVMLEVAKLVQGSHDALYHSFHCFWSGRKWFIGLLLPI